MIMYVVSNGPGQLVSEGFLSVPATGNIETNQGAAGDVFDALLVGKQDAVGAEEIADGPDNTVTRRKGKWSMTTMPA